MKKRILRRRFLIDRGFQLGIAFRLFACLLLVALVSGWAVYYAVWQTVLVEFHGVHLSRLYHAISERLIGYGMCTIIALSLLSIFFSHKISGPVYKMRHVIDSHVQKDHPLEQIHLRRGDALKDLADSLNNLFKTI